MDSSPQLPSRIPPLTLLRLVVSACERFDDEWKAGIRPRIESFLSETCESDRPRLLQELLALELELRRKVNEKPEPAEYRLRFPDYGPIIDAIFAGTSRLTDTELPPLSTPPPDDSPSASYIGSFQYGQVVEGYRIVARIGSGGMGIVFRAEQISAGRRHVALKCIRPDLLDGLRPSGRADAIARFRNEIEAVSNLDHPNLVPVYGVGEVDGCPYFSMKYLEGGTLADRLSVGPLPNRDAAVWMEKIARAVQHAHANNILHRDLKPGNILFDAAGEPYVADFGLAKELEPLRLQATPTRPELGTPSYMSPEQARGKEAIDVRSDVYSLGATLYHMLTGRPPFQASTTVETLRQVLNEEPVRPRSLVPTIGRDLESVCLMCLEKNPARRYASASDVADDLVRCLNGEPANARPRSAWRRVSGRLQRNANRVALAVAAAIAVVGITFGLWPRPKHIENLHKFPAEAPNFVYVQTIRNVGGNIKKGELDTFWETLLWPDLNFEREDPRSFEWYYLWHKSARNRCIRDMGPKGLGLEVQVSLDSRFVYALGFDRILRKWDIATGRLISRAPIEINGSHYGARFSADARHLVVGSGDALLQAISLWKIDGEEPVCLNRGVKLIGHGASISASGERLAFCAGSKGSIRQPDICIWDVKSRSLHRICSGSFDQPFALSPDGNMLAVGCGSEQNGKDGQSISLFDLRTIPPTNPRLIRLRDSTSLVCLVFSGDGKMLAVGENSQHFCVVPIAQEVPIQRFQVASKIVDRLAFSSDNRIVVCRSWHSPGPGLVESCLEALDLNSGNRLSSWKPNHTVDGVCITPDDRAIIVGSSKGLHYIGLDEIAESATWNNLGAQEVWSVACSPRGNLLAASGEANWLRLLDPVTGKEINRLDGHDAMVSCVAWSPDGEYLVSGGDESSAGNKKSRNVRLWNRDGSPPIVLDGMPSPVRCVAVSPDGKTIAAGGKDRVVTLWDVGTRRVVGELGPHLDQVMQVLFLPEDDLLVSIDDDGCWVRLWDWRKQQLLDFNSDPSAAWCAAISKVNATLAIGRKSGTIHLWQIVDRKLVHVRSIDGPPEPRAICFTPDGKSLAVSGSDQVVQFWHVDSGLHLLSLETMPAIAHCLTFSPDGERLYAALLNGKIRTWYAPRVEKPSPFLP